MTEGRCHRYAGDDATDTSVYYAVIVPGSPIVLVNQQIVKSIKFHKTRRVTCCL